MPPRCARSLRLPALLLALLSGAPRDARAEPTRTEIAAAKQLFAEASADEAREQWTAAIDKLTRVLAIKETAGVRFHIALCRERLGQLVGAASDYRRAGELAESMTSPDGKLIAEKSVAALVELGRRIPTLTVQLAPSSAAAQVSLGGRRLDPAELGRPLPLNPGEVTVEASLAGRKSFHKSLILIEGSTQSIAILLDPDVPPDDAPKVEAPPPPAPPAAPLPPPLASRPVRPEVLVAGGAAVALAGGAIGFAIKHAQLRSGTDTACADPAIVCDSKRQDRLHQYSTYALIGAAGALVAGGLTVYFAASSAGAPGAALGLAIAPSGASFVGRF